MYVTSRLNFSRDQTDDEHKSREQLLLELQAERLRVFQLEQCVLKQLQFGIVTTSSLKANPGAHVEESGQQKEAFAHEQHTARIGVEFGAAD